MSNYQNVKDLIDARIRQNGAQEITGTVLNNVLKQMIVSLQGRLFAGIATPNMQAPAVPDADVFYIAAVPGSYFDGSTVTDKVVIITNVGTGWNSETTNIPIYGQGGGGSVNVVQTTGQSTSDVMSQKAVTDLINAGYLYGGRPILNMDTGVPTQKLFFICDRKGLYMQNPEVVVTDKVIILWAENGTWRFEETNIPIKEYVDTPASKTTAGRVIIGDGIDVDATGKISVVGGGSGTKEVYTLVCTNLVDVFSGATHMPTFENFSTPAEVLAFVTECYQNSGVLLLKSTTSDISPIYVTNTYAAENGQGAAFEVLVGVGSLTGMGSLQFAVSPESLSVAYDEFSQASKDKLGLVKIGDGIDVDADGVISVNGGGSSGSDAPLILKLTSVTDNYVPTFEGYASADDLLNTLQDAYATNRRIILEDVLSVAEQHVSRKSICNSVIDEAENKGLFIANFIPCDLKSAIGIPQTPLKVKALSIMKAPGEEAQVMYIDTPISGTMLITANLNYADLSVNSIMINDESYSFQEAFAIITKALIEGRVIHFSDLYSASGSYSTILAAKGPYQDVDELKLIFESSRLDGTLDMETFVGDTYKYELTITPTGATLIEFPM